MNSDADDSNVVIVTGASRGIGRAIATRVACDGNSVLVACRTSESLAKDVVCEIEAAGGTAAPFVGDLVDHAVARQLLDAARELGPVGGLVNNAGSTNDRYFLLSKTDDWWATLSGKLAPTINCCRAVATDMCRRRRGVIVNITSLTGRRGSAGQTAYSAANGAIAAFTKSLAREIASFGVTVNAIAPGPVDTEMIRNLEPEMRESMASASPLRRIAHPDEIAQLVSFMIRNPTPVLLGQEIVVDGGITMQ